MPAPNLSRRAAWALQGADLTREQRLEAAVAVEKARRFTDLPEWVRDVITAREQNAPPAAEWRKFGGVPLTREHLQKMTPEGIAEANRQGLLRNMLRGH